MDSILCSRFAASAAARAFWISGKKSLYQIITPMTMPTWIMITLVRTLPKPNRTSLSPLAPDGARDARDSTGPPTPKINYARKCHCGEFTSPSLVRRDYLATLAN
jgi:hypothetical protein